MTVLAADKNVVHKLTGAEQSHPLIASDIVYHNALVNLNAAGNLKPAASTAGEVFAGIALEQGDNSSGSAGDIEVRVAKTGVWQVVSSGLDLTSVGKPCYITDDATVSLTFGPVYCGNVAEFTDSTTLHLDIEPACRPTKAGNNVGQVFLLTSKFNGAVGASAVTSMESLELNVGFEVLRGYVKCQTAPGGAYVLTCTITDGTSPQTVTVTGAATTGESEAINQVFAADADIDITWIDDDASGASADCEVTFVCRTTA